MYTDHRAELLHIANDQALSQGQFQQLNHLTSPQAPLVTQSAWLKRILVILAGLCMGLAVIFWVAANWNTLTIFHKFMMAEAILGVSLLAGCIQSRIRPAALLLAVLALGGLLALYAQVYSTSSGPWRLFAIWAGMALPIALAAKQQAVWVFWWLVVLLATTLWLEQFDRVWGFFDAWPIWVSWGILLLISVAFYPRGLFKQWLGRSPQHAFRWAMSCTLVWVLFTTFSHGFALDDFWVLFAFLCLGVTAAITYALYALRYEDRVVTAISILCIDAMLIAMLVRVFMETNIGVGGWILVTLVAGMASLALLVMSVRLLKKIHHSHKAQNAFLAAQTLPPSGDVV